MFVNVCRIEASSFRVIVTDNFGVSPTKVTASWARVAVRGGAPRNAPVSLKTSLSAGKKLLLAGRRDSLRPHLWLNKNGLLEAAGVTLSGLAGSSRGSSGRSHTTETLFSDCQLCRQRHCSSYLLGHPVRLLLVPSHPPGVASTSARRLARRWRGSDQNDFAGLDFAKAAALIDKPLVDDQLHNFGLVRESFCQAGFVLFILLFVFL